MEEQKKIQENALEETKQEKTESVKPILKITPKLMAIVGAAILLLIIVVTIIIGGNKNSGNENGKSDGNSINPGANNPGPNDSTNLGGDNNNDLGGGDANKGDSSNDNTVTKPISFYEFDKGYSEGLAFVTMDIYGSNPTCIDKNGNVIFSTGGGEVLSGFHNGWALLRKFDGNKEKIVLCDKTGNIKTAENIGGDALVYKAGAFEDGYIFVEKTTTNYQGSVDEMAIFNSKLEKIVDFSKELYNAYHSWNHYEYYNGYLLDYWNHEEKTYINLQTGEFGLMGDNFYDNMTPEYESDMWVIESSFEHFVYDRRDKTKAPIIDMTGTNMRICSKNYNYVRQVYMDASYASGFSSGYAGAVFSVLDSQVGERNYFTIIDENGDYCFEPIETLGEVRQVEAENGVFAIFTYSKKQQMCSIEVYDKTGRIGFMDFESNNYCSLGLQLSEGVICARYNYYYDDSLGFVGAYNTKLEPLFDVKFQSNKSL